MAQRAFAPEDKQQRRAAILLAAAALFGAGADSLPSAASIAARAGLAKGTLYLYFETKEDIFTALLMEGWGTVMDGMLLALRNSGSRRVKVQGLLEAYTAHLQQHPELLRLDALSRSILEKNYGSEALCAWKLALTKRFISLGTVADRVLHLPEGRGLQLLMRTYALTRGLWQSSDEANVEYASDPAFSPLYGSFHGNLREALEEYWRGALLPPRTGRKPTLPR